MRQPNCNSSEALFNQLRPFLKKDVNISLFVVSYESLRIQLNSLNSRKEVKKTVPRPEEDIQRDKDAAASHGCYNDSRIQRTETITETQHEVIGYINIRENDLQNLINNYFSEPGKVRGLMSGDIPPSVEDLVRSLQSPNLTTSNRPSPR